MKQHSKPRRYGQIRALGPLLIIMTALALLVLIFALRSRSNLPVMPPRPTATPNDPGIMPATTYPIAFSREAAFTRDTKMLATDDARDGSLHFYNTNDGTEIGGTRPTPTPSPPSTPGTMPAEQFTVHKLAISSDGAFVACLVTSNIMRGSDLGERLLLFDTKTRQQKFAWTVPHLQDVNIRKRLVVAFSDALTFSPDGSLVAGTTMSDTEHVEIYLWSTKTGELTRILKGPAKKVFREEFLDMRGIPVPTQQVMTGYYGTSREWADIPETSCLAFTPDGKTLLQARRDGGIAFWDLQSGNQTNTIQGLSTRIAWITLSPDGKEFAVGDQNRMTGPQSNTTGQRLPDLAILDTATGKLLRTWHGFGPLAYSSDGKLLAGVGSNGTNIAVWNAQSGNPLQNLKGKNQIINAIEAVSFSANGKSIMACSQVQPLCIWNLP